MNFLHDFFLLLWSSFHVKLNYAGRNFQKRAFQCRTPAF